MYSMMSMKYMEVYNLNLHVHKNILQKTTGIFITVSEELVYILTIINFAFHSFTNIIGTKREMKL